MQFLSNVFIRCPDCNGRRYRAHILEVKLRGFSIADLLEATVEEAVDFLYAFPESPPARRALRGLHLLEEVGLGYVKLGQPINTLSGGESQRLKLVSHLTEVAGDLRLPLPGLEALAEAPRAGASQTRRTDGGHLPSPPSPLPLSQPEPMLFLFDEVDPGIALR